MSRQAIAEGQPVSLEDRIRGAIWGQFLGDAFCLGSHWIYDRAELERRFPDGPRGFETPPDGHYHYGKTSGDQTHYGDAALLQLQSLSVQGAFDAVDFGSRFVAMIESPEYRGYRDHAAKGTVEKARAFRAAHPGEAFPFQDGADDDQPATVSRLASVVALHFRDTGLPGIVEQATRVCQNNDRAVAYARAHALVLRGLFSGNGLEEAFLEASGLMEGSGVEGAEVAARIRAAMADRHLEVIEATLKFGQVCPLASSFPAAVQCALRHSGDLAAAFGATAAAGGDSAGRAAMVGAWLGGALGSAAIPGEWLRRLSAGKVLSECVEMIVGRVCRA